MIMMVMVMLTKYFNHNINKTLQSSPRVAVEEEEDGNTLVVRGVTQLDEVGICSAQGGIKWGIRGSGILDSEGSHR